MNNNSSQQTSNLKPTGMESLDIKDSQLSVLFIYNQDHGTDNARLNKQPYQGKPGAWCAIENNVNQWISVDLGSIKTITGVATQGRSDCDQWVTKYVISYSDDNLNHRIFNLIYNH